MHYKLLYLKACHFNQELPNPDQQTLTEPVAIEEAAVFCGG